MSNSRMLACEECKKEIWVGLEHTPLFSKQEDCLEALGVFLNKHKDHPLRYFTAYVFTDYVASYSFEEVRWGNSVKKEVSNDR